MDCTRGPRAERRERVRAGRAIVLACVLGSCAGSAPVDPTLVQREEERLMQPFRTARAIVADRLELTMTANFYDELTERALLSGLQERKQVKRDDGGSSYVYSSAGTDAPLRFRLGETELAVLERAVVTVLGGRHELTLRADLRGMVTVQEAGERFHAESVRIADGKFARH